MAYEIPQQLEHKEKIMWGLTFGQLGWAFLFGSIALILLLREGSLYLNASLALIPIIIGILFVFFGVYDWIKRIILFFRLRNITVNSKLMEVFHSIKDIKDDTLTAKKDLAVLEIFPINYKIKTEGEKESINIGFQKFLNSFDFPVQIVMTTQKLSIDSYLESISTKVKEKKLFESFKIFITDYIAKNEMRNRRFFLIIPKVSELKIQCQVLSERLQSLGLVNRRLNDDQLVEFIRVFFNAQTTVPESRDIIQKVVGLEQVNSHFDYVKVNEKFCRIIVASGYPRSVDGGFLDKIISTDGDFDISIHIEPFNINTMMVMLNSELQKQRADLYSEQLRGSITPSLEIKYADTKRVLEELQKGEEKLFQVSLYINCKADSLEKLDLLTKKVESELNAVMIIPEVPKFRQLEGYRSMIPVSQNYLQMRRNVGTKALSAFFPFTSPFLPLEQTGVMLGLNRNNIPLIRDIFALSNPNGLVLATSGAGKSYFTKLLILRQLMNGTRVIVIDPQSEYLDLVQAYNGQIVTISKDSDTIINPLDPMGHDFLEKRLALMDMFKIMFGELTDVQKSILDRAVTETYNKFAMHKKNNIPIMQDLYNTLKRQSKNATNMDGYTYSALLNRLYIFTGGVFQFLNKKTKIDFTSNFVCFNIGNMPKQVKPLVMFLILDYVYMKMKESKEQKLLIVDEAWSLLSQTEEASYIFEIVKTCRKYNMGLLLITQDVADLVNSKAGHAVLANSAYTLLLRQKSAIIDSIVKTFSLSNHEKEYLLSATKGAGIFIADNDHQEMKVIASPEEHKLITTNPNENSVDNKPKEFIEKLEPYYPIKGMKPERMLYLRNRGYEPDRIVLFGETNARDYMIYKRGNSGTQHSFYMTYVANYLKSKGAKNIKLWDSTHPDIVFENKKGTKFYIEIEAGDSIQKNKLDRIKKFQDVESIYNENIIIVVLVAKLADNYRTITNIPVMIRKDLPQWIASCLRSHSKCRR